MNYRFDIICEIDLRKNYLDRFKSRPSWNYASKDELTTFLILDGNSEWVQADQSMIYQKFMPEHRTYYRILLDGRLTENGFINTFLTFYYLAMPPIPQLPHIYQKSLSDNRTSLSDEYQVRFCGEIRHSDDDISILWPRRIHLYQGKSNNVTHCRDFRSKYLNFTDSEIMTTSETRLKNVQDLTSKIELLPSEFCQEELKVDQEPKASLFLDASYSIKYESQRWSLNFVNIEFNTDTIFVRRFEHDLTFTILPALAPDIYSYSTCTGIACKGMLI